MRPSCLRHGTLGRIWTRRDGSTPSPRRLGAERSLVQIQSPRLNRLDISQGDGILACLVEPLQGSISCAGDRPEGGLGSVVGDPPLGARRDFGDHAKGTLSPHLLAISSVIGARAVAAAWAGERSDQGVNKAT